MISVSIYHPIKRVFLLAFGRESCILKRVGRVPEASPAVFGIESKEEEITMSKSTPVRGLRARLVRSSVAAVSLLALAGAAQAAFVPVSIASDINADLRTFTNSLAYPVGGQTLDFAGVPFALGLRFDDPDSLGVVGTNGIGTAEVHSFAVSIPDALRVYTLINSGFGLFGAYNGKIEVFGTNNAYASLDLVQGNNIRDHLQNVFQNSISDPTVVATNFADGVRLDRQVLELNASFIGQTVTEFRFTGGPVDTFTQGVAFLAGATFETIPTPGAGTLAALGLLAAARRRR